MKESTSPLGRARQWTALRVVGIAFVVLILLGIVLRGSVLSAAAGILHVGEEPVAADLIFLLGGDIHGRPEAAAQLYHQGVAPLIVLTRVRETLPTRIGAFPNETDATALFLRYLNVPDSAIFVLQPPEGVRSTTEEAIELREYLSRNPAERVLVVTSDYHTRRARWNLRRQLRGVPVEIRMVGAADPRFDQRNWWRCEQGMIVYFNEYVKFVHNWLYR